MAEAIIILRAIANANQEYYLANGTYAQFNEMDKLTVDIPGKVTQQVFDNRIATKYFIYSPDRTNGQAHLAVANRSNDGETGRIYILSIKPSDPSRIHCDIIKQDGLSTKVQQELCAAVERNGML